MEGIRIPTIKYWMQNEQNWKLDILNRMQYIFKVTALQGFH